MCDCARNSKCLITHKYHQTLLTHCLIFVLFCFLWNSAVPPLDCKAINHNGAKLRIIYIPKLLPSNGSHDFDSSTNFRTYSTQALAESSIYQQHYSQLTNQSRTTKGPCGKWTLRWVCSSLYCANILHKDIGCLLEIVFLWIYHWRWKNIRPSSASLITALCLTIE